MEIPTLGLIAGSSLTSGINLYLTVAVLGITHRLEWLTLPGQLEVFGNPLVISVALVIFVIEFLADKFPYIDNMWDSVHMFVRPVGGAVIAYLATSDMNAPIQTAVALAAGTLTLDSHLTKATSRLAINASPEPFSTVAASLIEDTFVVIVFFLIIQFPLIATLIALLFVLFSIWFLTIMFRFVRKLFPKRYDT